MFNVQRTNPMLSFRRAAALLLLPAGLAASACSKPAEAAGPTITVYKSPTCGCCTNWEEHLRENGFQVESVKRTDMAGVKQEHGVPPAMQSCHTGVVDGYVVEGHVPAAVIKKLLADRPAVKGVAVPGMPMGSPGMEGPYEEPYEVFTFDANGPKDVYAVQ